MSAVGVLCAGLSACSPDLPPVGHTWAVDLESTTWVAPDNIEALVALYAGDYPFFVSIQTQHSPYVDMLFVLGTADGQQDTCSRTIIMEDVRFKSNGDFQAGPFDFGLANGLNTEQLTMKGTLSEDMTTLQNIEITGYIDLGTIPADVFDPGDSTVCELVEVMKIPCAECPAGDGDCVYIHATDVKADQVGDVPIELVEQPDCHETCDASAENPECDL